MSAISKMSTLGELLDFIFHFSFIQKEPRFAQQSMMQPRSSERDTGEVHFKSAVLIC